MDNKLGIGYITCGAPERVKETFKTIPKDLGEIVVINSGGILSISEFEGANEVYQWGLRKSIAVAKNKALRYLINSECDHIFLMEDDIKITDPTVFKKYVKTAQSSGIWHLNCALQKDSNNNPRAKFKYDDLKVSFHSNPSRSFQYFYRGIIKNIGYFDEKYVNVYENVDYLYRVIQKGLHPPFWWFADIDNSDLYLEYLKNSDKTTDLKNDPNNQNNLAYGKSWFKDKFGVVPELIPDTDEKIALKKVQNIKNKYAKELIK